MHIRYIRYYMCGNVYSIESNQKRPELYSKCISFGLSFVRTHIHTNTRSKQHIQNRNNDRFNLFAFSLQLYFVCQWHRGLFCFLSPLYLVLLLLNWFRLFAIYTELQYPIHVDFFFSLLLFFEILVGYVIIFHALCACKDFSCVGVCGYMVCLV